MIDRQWGIDDERFFCFSVLCFVSFGLESRGKEQANRAKGDHFYGGHLAIRCEH